MATRFRVNSPNVIHETIEGEVILIDLKTGTYYSLRDSGAAVWHAIERGADEEEIRGALELRYDGSEQEMRDAVRALLGELEAESLIRPDESTAPGAEIRPVSVDEEDAHQAVSAWSTSGHPASRSEITRRSTAGQSMASLGSSQRRPRAASGA